MSKPPPGDMSFVRFCRSVGERAESDGKGVGDASVVALDKLLLIEDKDDAAIKLLLFGEAAENWLSNLRLAAKAAFNCWELKRSGVLLA